MKAQNITRVLNGVCFGGLHSFLRRSAGMNIVSISDEFIELCSSGDREFIIKHGTPYIIAVRLRFRGKRRDFAVPFRSNIALNVSKDQYFKLSPRPSQREGLRTRRFGGRYSCHFDGSIVPRRCRNSIRRYSAALKREFESQFSYSHSVIKSCISMASRLRGAPPFPHLLESGGFRIPKLNSK